MVGAAISSKDVCLAHKLTSEYTYSPKYRNPSEHEKDLSEDMAKVPSHTQPTSVIRIIKFI